MLTGGCFCGAIRYEVIGNPSHRTNCHCSICRRTSGAPFVTWFSVPRSEFRFIRGVPTEFRSSPKAVRCFCPSCGTQLTFQHSDAAEEIDITTCSLDDPQLAHPEDHTWIGSKLQWIELADHLPAFDEARPKE
jgi:hypothetical protein